MCPISDFVISSPLSPFDNSEGGTIYLYLGAGPNVVVDDSYTQVRYYTGIFDFKGFEF